MKIVIVDDNLIIRKLIKKYFLSENRYEIIGEANGADDFFALKNYYTADIILMDLQMPNASGYFITKELLKSCCYLKVIAITTHEDQAYLEELIDAGFKGCIYKSDFYENIDEAIRSVHDNKYYFPREMKL